MPSLNLDLNYFDHAKTMRLESILGNGADVLPIRLWAYVGRHNPEQGRVSMLEGELERVCRWWGEKGAMVAAMMKIGFIEKDGEFYEIHDWLDHSGHLSAFKKRAIKANRIRWGKRSKSRTPTRTPKHEAKESPSSAVPFSAVHNNKKSVFSKPSAHEVKVYGASIGFVIDGDAFCDFYESKGWKVGNTPMKDWKAAVRTWRKRDSTPVKGETAVKFPGINLKPGQDPWKEAFEKSEKESTEAPSLRGPA